MITQSGNTLTSSFGSGNQWYVGGKAITGATGSTYAPAQSGNYQVKATLPSGCEVASDNFVYVILANNPGNTTDIGLVLYPIPASAQLNVIFAAKANADLNLSLINAAGKIVYVNHQSIAAGNFSTVLDVSSQAPGSYVLKLVLGQKEYNTKVVIFR